jgi:CheY-like chemotaxis protein
VRRSARVVSEACDRGGSITRRLLTFARRGNLCAQALDPVSVLAGVGDIMAPALDAAITLRIDAAPGLPQMYADHGQLETALVNLAANARDAMPDGGTLTLSASAGLLPEGIAVHGDGNADGAAVPAVCLSVSDTGVGMDGATLSRVFEPFFTTKPRGSGTGLGLPMVKGFAEQSGGGVSVDSLQGRGTTVAIWLPQAPEQEVRTENAAASAARAAGPPLRVLVVDDDPLVLEALAGELGAGGFAVAAATSGAAALELLDGGALFDAIVSDLSMPGMDGVSLISAVQERLPHLAAVLLTGYAADAVVEALERNARGPFAVLRKPLRGREIAARISALLDGQRCAAA